MSKHKPLLYFPLLLFVANVVAVCAPADYAPPKPTAKVAVLRDVWHDAERERDVPVKVYYPEKSDGPVPLIIFSHGLGGTREGYEYLGEHWAGCGYVSVHLQHAGSDDAVWRNGGMEGMRKAVANPQNAINRVKDVRFAIDRVLVLNADPGSPWHGRIDPARIGMAGHSFGAWTTLAAVGERIGPFGETLADRRIKAAIPMSPIIPNPTTETLAGIKVPVFEMTGTRDESPITKSPASERRLVFDNLSAPGSLLVIFKDVDHMTFSGHVLRSNNSLDVKFQPLIVDASTAFWDAWLGDNGAAKEWLYRGGFAKRLGADGTFEEK